MKLCRLILFVACVLCLNGGAAFADYVEVSRSAIVRAEPTRNAEQVERVGPGTRLMLLDSGRTKSGYYHVRTTNTRRSGWVYRNRVRRHRGPIPPVAAPKLAVSRFEEIHHQLCLYGCPKGTPATNDLVSRNIYVLSNNRSTKFADWVAYRVTKSTIGKSKTRNWKRDPELDPTVTLSPKDYKDAHAKLAVDRGHQAPLASFSGSPSWRQTNYLSNITPQKSALNQGPWQRLEHQIRELAKLESVDAAYVMTGPLYTRTMPNLPEAAKSHRVPSAYWKVVAVEQGSRLRMAGFYFDQETARSASYCKHAVTVDVVEEKSRLDFFYRLADETEEKVEADGKALLKDLGC